MANNPQDIQHIELEHDQPDIPLWLINDRFENIPTHARDSALALLQGVTIDNEFTGGYFSCQIDPKRAREFDELLTKLMEYETK